MASQTYHFRRWSQLNFLGFMVLAQAFFAAAVFAPHLISDSLSGNRRGIYALILVITLPSVIRLIAGVFRGPVRLTDDGIYNPTVWRKELRLVAWGDIKTVTVRRLAFGGQQLVITSMTGQSTTLGLGPIKESSQLVSDIKSRVPPGVVT